VANDHVLVTGAGGFIGSNLVDDQLSRGRTVTALDVNLERLQHQKSNRKCLLVVGDVRNAELLEKVTKSQNVIFHLASAHLEVNQTESYFREINVDAVAALAKVAEKNNVDRLVHCSSVGVYGPLDRLPADEKTPCHPDIIYERTKLMGEEALRAAADELSWVIVRPSWVYGPRCHRTLKLLRTIKSKKFFMVGKQKTYRHPVYISDLLEGFELAANNDAAIGETFILSGNEPVLLEQLVQQIAATQNSGFRPLTVPLTLMVPLCFLVEKTFAIIGKEPPFSRRSLKFFTESSAFNISKAREVIGYSPQVSLAEGLGLTNRYFEEQNLL